MIPLKINGQKLKIKAIHEMTAKEFIEFSKIENPDKIKYISFITGVEYLAIFNSKIPNNILAMIGELEDITKIKPPKSILGYPLNRYDIDTVGQRFQLDNCNLKGYELLVFIVAVALANDPDLNKVNDFVKRLYDYPYREVMAAGNFFFQRSSFGKRKGLLSFTNIRALISTGLRRNRLE